MKHSTRFSISATTQRPRSSGLPTTFSTAHIAPGREGFFNLVKSAPPTLKYEPGLVVAEGNYVIAHGRFSGHGLANAAWIAADIVRMTDGLLAEHWDVLQDEATRETSQSGLPMFGDKFIE